MLQTHIHSFYFPPRHSLTHSHRAHQLEEHPAGLRQDVEGEGELQRDQQLGEQREVVSDAELPLDDALIVDPTTVALLVAGSCLMCLIWMCLSGSCWILFAGTIFVDSDSRLVGLLLFLGSHRWWRRRGRGLVVTLEGEAGQLLGVESRKGNRDFEKCYGVS